MRFIATYYATLATSNENRQHKKYKFSYKRKKKENAKLIIHSRGKWHEHKYKKIDLCDTE